MKKLVFKLLTLLLFTGITVSSCSVAYREGHRQKHDQERRDGDHHDRDDHNHNTDHHDNR